MLEAVGRMVPPMEFEKIGGNGSLNITLERKLRMSFVATGEQDGQVVLVRKYDKITYIRLCVVFTMRGPKRIMAITMLI